VFLQFVQHAHSQTGTDHASSLQHSLGSVSRCQGTRCGFRGILRSLSEKTCAPTYILRVVLEMCAEIGPGLHVQCTAPTGVTKLRGTFLHLPVEKRHEVYAVQAEVPVLRIGKEIHKQSLHEDTEGKRSHREPEQLQQSAFMLWF